MPTPIARPDLRAEDKHPTRHATSALMTGFISASQDVSVLKAVVLLHTALITLLAFKF